MAGRLLDDEPELAWEHALAARARGARIGAVREATGLAAYRTGRYAQALAELRTLRRLTGSSDHLPIMADCERGLGRPERALALAASPEAGRLATPERVELLIVAAGARSDLGQHDAAVLALHLPELESTSEEEWVSRLRLAYANALIAVGRTDEAAEWASRAGASLGEDDLDEDANEDPGLDLIDLLETDE
jgi:tetratricopeptide (TPR) repeat protein